jgi:hypothetical protein
MIWLLWWNHNKTGDHVDLLFVGQNVRARIGHELLDYLAQVTKCSH